MTTTLEGYSLFPSAGDNEGFHALKTMAGILPSEARMFGFRFPPDRPSTRGEQLAGRFLALCAHPIIAWRVTSARARLAIVLGYAAAAYASVLTALLAAQF